MISGLVPDMDHYLSVKEDALNLVHDMATKIATNHDIEIYMNTADRPDKGIAYLTVTGTSAEHGDDGMTGRGNRANGLITPLRPMSLEATAGKNPVSHVGKIYNVLASKISQRIINEVPKILEVYVELLSQIGKPIDEPLAAVAKFLPDKGADINVIRSDVESIINDELERISEITDTILKSEIMLF
jgi:S-adenosylmethionine synthetase